MKTFDEFINEENTFDDAMTFEKLYAYLRDTYFPRLLNQKNLQFINKNDTEGLESAAETVAYALACKWDLNWNYMASDTALAIYNGDLRKLANNIDEKAWPWIMAMMIAYDSIGIYDVR